ncbi:MAG: hypothetical protein B7Y25_04870 [Alphaproteobacteria bacterium 16-39-46]|nr:MAG: hypothetical protein B7Y25_04870 [Alphaproteobacteria bacterium 16-39-46]OZA42870.1 MAG: hypothetical protein B7X84_04795 [Alphaproteobacteria bacterium 17-39-52]HQS84258.1 disulfide bond formation protein B [Alphaproteobacteria bacterium]HQS94090.1 disulfide bond formation protein B [Alphaproteobacteria bacterium]
MISLDRLKFIFGGAFFIGSIGLLTAYVAEYVFNLSPCILCVYERIPYGFSLLFGLFGWIRPKIFPKVLLFCLFLAFLAGTGLSFYHAGIEHDVFPSFGACGADSKALTAESIEELETLILATPVIRCDQVYFRFLGLSMTEYNFMFSFMVTSLLGFVLYRVRKPKR